MQNWTGHRRAFALPWRKSEPDGLISPSCNFAGAQFAGDARRSWRKARAVPHPAQRRIRAKRSELEWLRTSLGARSSPPKKRRGRSACRSGFGSAARSAAPRPSTTPTTTAGKPTWTWATCALSRGPTLQRLTYYAWETGLTRFSTERLGYTLTAAATSARRTWVTTFHQRFTRPAISQYDVLWRPGLPVLSAAEILHLRARRWRAGAYGNFSGDTNGIQEHCPPGSGTCLLYPTGVSYAASASVIGEYNVAPNIALKLVPEYFFTGFGSTVQASRGFTAGMVYRWGKR